MGIPKSEIMFATDLHKGRNKTIIMVPKQWILTSYNGIKAYVPNPYSKRGRKCGV